MKKISLIVIVFILGGTVLTSELSERDLFRKELDIINEIICEQFCEKGITMNKYGCTCNNTDVNLEKKRSSHVINCEVLCFMGQGGKACNCDFTPFVGKRR